MKGYGAVNTQEFGCKDASGKEVVAGGGTQIDPGRAVEPVVNAASEGLQDIGGKIIIAVSFFILMFGNFMLGIAGTLFNWVVLVTVYQFGTYFGNSAGVLLAWGILRDLANIVLLFGFIFIGLQTILDLNSFSVKKTLPRLLIFAVLLNFSLFATEAIIDATNVFSAVLSTQAGTGCTPDARGIKECVNYGIAGAIMKSTGLAAMFDPNIHAQMYGEDMKAASVFLGAALFSVIGAFVIGAAAIMLLIRAITLTFLMVLSPLGFAALAVPGFEKIGKEWWKTTLNQAAFAPVLILLILVSLKIAEGFKVANSSGTSASIMAGLAAQNTSALGVIIIYALIIGFLVASIVVAKKMGAIGADFATATAGGVMAGTAGFIGRRTVGFAGAQAAKAIRGSKFGRSNVGRMFAGAADKAAGASFDARGVIAKVPGASKISLGEAGKVAKSGYAGIRKKAKEERVKYGASLTQTKEEKAREAAAAAAIKSAEEGQAIADREDKMRIDAQRDDNQFELRPYQQAVNDRRKDLETAKASGDAAQIKSSEESLRTALEDFNQKKAELQVKVDVLAEARAEKQAEHKDVVSAYQQEEKEAKEAPQRGYAADLEKARILSAFSVGGYADKEGAKAIVAELKKSKTDKQLEKLEKAVEKAGEKAHTDAEHLKAEIKKEGDDHGNDNHPPAGGGDAHAKDAHH